MKWKLLLLLSLFSFNLFAQDIQFQVSKNSSKIVFEYFEQYKRHNICVYGEIMNGDVDWTYLQAMYQYQFWKVSAHAEIRSFITQGCAADNAYLVGLSIPLFYKEQHYLSLATLYRYNNGNQYHATLTYGTGYKKLTFDGYFECYGDSRFYAFSENKIKYHFYKLYIGMNIEYSLAEKQHNVTNYFIFGFKL